MEVILKENVEGLGQIGEVVNVKPGYARNYLIPRNLAIPATPEWSRRSRSTSRNYLARVMARRYGSCTVSTSMNFVVVGMHNWLSSTCNPTSIANHYGNEPDKIEYQEPAGTHLCTQGVSLTSM